MASKQQYTGYDRTYVTVTKNNITMIEFKNNRPNYFKVANNGTSPIYCSTSGYPSNKMYDFKVDGGKTQIFAEPYFRDRIYIYNPSTSQHIPIILTTFSAEFDPSVFALGELGIGVNGKVETDGIIKGFETPLPSGNNLIGNVKLSGELPDGNNNIGKVVIDSITNGVIMKVSPVQTEYTFNNKTILEGAGGSDLYLSCKNLKYMYSDSDFQIKIANNGIGYTTIKGGIPYVDFLRTPEVIKIYFSPGESPINIIYGS